MMVQKLFVTVKSKVVEYLENSNSISNLNQVLLTYILPQDSFLYTKNKTSLCMTCNLLNPRFSHTIHINTQHNQDPAIQKNKTELKDFQFLFQISSLTKDLGPNSFSFWPVFFQRKISNPK